MATNSEVALSWSRQDIEQRLGFRGGRYTSANNWFTALAALVLTVLFYAALIPLDHTALSAFADMHTKRGPTPYFTVFFSAWALMILWVKWRKLVFQRKTLQYVVVPQDHDFVLSSGTVDMVVERIYATVDDPRQFVLFNRILIALSNLRNLGQVTDVDDILASQAERDESIMETSYSVVGGLIWAIPVLGFIGTVLGLSRAISQFGGVLKSASDISEIKTSLTGVTGGLATAFETTLQALVAALCIQLILTMLKRSEEEFLDRCSEYCVHNIVNRLRIMPYERELD